MANWVVVKGKRWINISRKEGEGAFEDFQKRILLREGTEPFITTSSSTSCFYNHGIKEGATVLSIGPLGVICRPCLSRAPIRSAYVEEMKKSKYHQDVTITDEIYT